MTAISILRCSSFLLALSLLVTLSPVEAKTNNLATNTGLIQSRNTINGIVSNTDGQPINRIRVELADEVEMTVMQTYTDSTGRYTFRNLTSGIFIVKVHSDGKYAANRARVNLYGARSGGSSQEQVDFVLKTLTESRTSPTPSNSGTVFAQEVPDSARKIFERAARQLDNRQTEQGMASLKEAIGIFPTYFQALERLGIEHVRRQEYEPAFETLARAVKVNPNGAASLYVLGVVQFHLHQLSAVVDSLRRSLLLAPGSPNASFAHFYLGLALWKLGRHGDAEPHLRKALELGPNSTPPDVHLYLAQHYSDTQRYKEAADELDLFLKFAPDARDAESIRVLIRKLRAKTQYTNLLP